MCADTIEKKSRYFFILILHQCLQKHCISECATVKTSVFPSKIICIPATPEFINYLPSETPAGGESGQAKHIFIYAWMHQTGRILSQTKSGLFDESHQE